MFKYVCYRQDTITAVNFSPSRSEYTNLSYKNINLTIKYLQSKLIQTIVASLLNPNLN
jgi:hypothetical protein